MTFLFVKKFMLLGSSLSHKPSALLKSISIFQ